MVSVTVPRQISFILSRQPSAMTDGLLSELSRRAGGFEHQQCLLTERGAREWCEVTQYFSRHSTMNFIRPTELFVKLSVTPFAVRGRLEVRLPRANISVMARMHFYSCIRGEIERHTPVLPREPSVIQTDIDHHHKARAWQGSWAVPPWISGLSSGSTKYIRLDYLI